MPNKNAKVIIPLVLAIYPVAYILEKTEAPKAVYVACAVASAIAIPLIVFYLMAESGWSTLRIGTTTEALYLSMLFSKIPILGLFFPNVQIPWRTVRNARSFEAPGFFRTNRDSGAQVQVNYDPNYTGTYIEMEIGEPPVFLQLPASILGDAASRLPLAARK